MILDFFLLTVPATLFFVAIAWMVQSHKEKAFSQRAASIPNFTASRSFVSPYNKSGLALDVRRRKVLILPSGSLLSGRDILAVEVIKDGVSLQKTNRGSQAVGAAIGGAILGPVGLLLGGLSGSKRSEERTKTAVLRISVNSLSHPFHDVTFFWHPGGVAANDSTLRSQVSEMDYWHTALKALMLDSTANEDEDTDAAPKETVRQLVARKQAEIAARKAAEAGADDRKVI